VSVLSLKTCAILSENETASKSPEIIKIPKIDPLPEPLAREREAALPPRLAPLIESEAGRRARGGF